MESGEIIVGQMLFFCVFSSVGGGFVWISCVYDLCTFDPLDWADVCRLYLMAMYQIVVDGLLFDSDKA